MSHSSVSGDMSRPQTVRILFLYITFKYRDWLVIGSVTGGGRARTMVCVQALLFFFWRPNPVARDSRFALASCFARTLAFACKIKTQNNNACSAG